MSSLISFLLFAGIGYWILRSVMGPGIDVAEEAQKLKARRQAAQAQAPPRSTGGKSAGGKSAGGKSAGVKTSLPVSPHKGTSAMQDNTEPLAWYVVLDVPPDASRREIMEAVKRRLEVAQAWGDTHAPARIARAAANAMKLRLPSASTRGRRQ